MVDFDRGGVQFLLVVGFRPLLEGFGHLSNNGTSST